MNKQYFSGHVLCLPIWLQLLK